MLVCLFAQLVRGQVVSFAMRDGSSHVSVGSEVVQFGGSLVRSLGHYVLLGL
jgi:hypothetical protein